MRNASGHQCKKKMSGSEKKVNENTYDISSIKRVTKKFLEVSRCSRAKQRQRNVQKKVCCTCKVAFLLIRPIAVFPVLRRCSCRLALHDFIFCLNEVYIIIYYRELRFQPWLNLWRPWCSYGRRAGWGESNLSKNGKKINAETKLLCRCEKTACKIQLAGIRTLTTNRCSTLINWAY